MYIAKGVHRQGCSTCTSPGVYIVRSVVHAHCRSRETWRLREAHALQVECWLALLIGLPKALCLDLLFSPALRRGFTSFTHLVFLSCSTHELMRSHSAPVFARRIHWHATRGFGARSSSFFKEGRTREGPMVYVCGQQNTTAPARLEDCLLPLVKEERPRRQLQLSEGIVRTEGTTPKGPLDPHRRIHAPGGGASL